MEEDEIPMPGDEQTERDDPFSEEEESDSLEEAFEEHLEDMIGDDD